jgi:membrane protein
MSGIWHLIQGILDVVRRGIAAARRRSETFNHAWCALERYNDVNAGRLAAATAYYGFFSVFALAVVTFVMIGLAFRNNRTVVANVSAYLASNLPSLQTDSLIEGSQRIGIIALVGLVFAGVSWVETLRSSQRAVWKFDQQPGNVFVRWFLDFAVLIGLGILLLISIAIFSGIQDFLLSLTDRAPNSPLRTGLRGTTTLIAGLVDLFLGMLLLAGVPRLRMSLRRLLPPALLFAVGLFILKTAGKWYINRIEDNPAYQLVGGTVGLLLFMYLLHQVLLFSAALAATDTRGRVVDLAGGEIPPDVLKTARLAERAAEHVEVAAVATDDAAKQASEMVQQLSSAPLVSPGEPRAARSEKPDL